MKNAIRVRKSLEMTKTERSALAKWVKAQPTKIDAAQTLGISRPSLDRILMAGRGRQDVIEKVIGVVVESETVKS